MKKVYAFLVFLCVLPLAAQTVDFGTSLQFKQAVVTSNTLGGITYGQNGEHIKADANSDGLIQLTEAELVYKIVIDNNYSLQGLTGLQYFTNLEMFSCSDTGIVTLNFPELPNLETLYFDGTALTGITFQNLPAIKNLTVTQTNVTAINVSGLTTLVHLNISHNNIYSAVSLFGFSSLITFDGGYNGIPSVDFTGATSLQEIIMLQNQLSTINLAGMESSLTILNILNNHVNAPVLTGFSALKTLSCAGNGISVLDIQPLTSLEYLYCQNNIIGELNAEGLANVIEITAYNNNLTSVNVQGAQSLQTLNISDNSLAGTLDVHNLASLANLNCSQNSLTAINTQELPALGLLNCEYNQITEIELSGLPGLNSLICNNNALTTINLEQSSLGSLSCKNNQITTLFLKNGYSESVTFDNNPLVYICADDNQLYILQNKLTQMGLSDTVELNSLCNDIASQSNTLSGTVTFYLSAFNYPNGGHVPAKNLQMRCIGNAFGSGMQDSFTNDEGLYSFTLYSAQSGNLYTMPENPDLFATSVKPFNIQYFPDWTETININFWPSNTPTQDIEVVLLPVNAAKPGEDANYRLLLRNKGNVVTSGTLNLAFDDAVMDLVSSTIPANSTTTGQLTWNFSDLMPFDSIQSDLVFHLNMPTDTPAVDAGYVLDFTATVTLAEGDDYTPADNTFDLNQVVVNSLDPNDKTCLEGNLIPTSEVGNYVHYIIRFENTGTANADRVVVTDVIDEDKFDIYSLISLSGSHNFRTQIVNGKVSFVFDDINLSFEDGSNDGFVAFKVKTLSTLTEGDTFSNTAKIFFDYNLPIVTNTAITSVGVLGADNFNFEKNFTIYPNPATEKLYITSKKGLAVKSAAIYNMLGQVIMAVPDSGNSIDVSPLPNGTYILKLYSDKGYSTTKFVKK